MNAIYRNNYVKSHGDILDIRDTTMQGQYFLTANIKCNLL